MAWLGLPPGIFPACADPHHPDYAASLNNLAL